MVFYSHREAAGVDLAEAEIWLKLDRLQELIEEAQEQVVMLSTAWRISCFAAVFFFLCVCQHISQRMKRGC